MALSVKRAYYNVGKVFKEAGLGKSNNILTHYHMHVLTHQLCSLAMDRFGSRIENDVAYMQELSRHRQLMPLYNIIPHVDNAWIAPNAALGEY